MKFIAYILIFVILNSVSYSSSKINTINSSIHFYKNDFEDIAKKAKKENKLIMLFIYSNYGSWCNKMRNETFHNKNVLSLLKKHYISIQLDRIEEEIDIPDEINALTSPSIFLINPKTMETLDSSIGYINGSDLSDKLDHAIYFYNN